MGRTGEGLDLRRREGGDGLHRNVNMSQKDTVEWKKYIRSDEKFIWPLCLATRALGSAIFFLLLLLLLFVVSSSDGLKHGVYPARIKSVS